MDSTPLLHETNKPEKVSIPINVADESPAVNGNGASWNDRQVIPVYLHLTNLSYFLGTGQSQVQILHDVSMSFR